MRLSTFHFALHHTMQVPQQNGPWVLFYSGATGCGLWQAPLYILAVVLVVVPLLPLVVAFTGAVNPSYTPRSTASKLIRRIVQRIKQGKRMGMLWRSLQHCVSANFKPEWWMWFALLTFQRVLMVAVQNVATDNIVKSVGQVVTMTLTVIVCAIAWCHSLN